MKKDNAVHHGIGLIMETVVCATTTVIDRECTPAACPPTGCRTSSVNTINTLFTDVRVWVSWILVSGLLLLQLKFSYHVCLFSYVDDFQMINTTAGYCGAAKMQD